jgi:hypothetical protein
LLICSFDSKLSTGISDPAMSDSSDHAEEEDLMVEDDDTTSASEDGDEAAAVEVVAVAAVPSDQEDEDTDAEVEEAQEVQVVVVDEEDDEGEDADDDEGNGHAADAEAEAVVAVAVVEEEEEEEPAPVKAPKKIPRKSQKKSPTPSKGKKEIKKRKRKKSRRSEGEDIYFSRISGRRMGAANSAREMLIQTVPRLPVMINDSFIVRSFGQLHVEASNKFSTANALFPVGFCCDRYEYSPTHGRVLKLRCAILDGQRTNVDYDGPIFRVMWGQGVDDDVDKVEYPYNPYANSAPVASSGSDDVLAIPAAPGGASSEMVVPTNGMRVKVRFDKDQFYYGTITSVEDTSSEKKKKKRKQVKIMVRYDDGSSEEAVYPDPDITLVMPGVYAYFPPEWCTYDFLLTLFPPSKATMTRWTKTETLSCRN